jgi:hypothetical protein
MFFSIKFLKGKLKRIFMDYFRKLERLLKVTGNEDLIMDYGSHLGDFLGVCNKKPFEITADDINVYIKTKKEASFCLKLFYSLILRKG